MISPTNYHIPTQVAEAFARYHTGLDSSLSGGIEQDQVTAVHKLAEEITDPSKNLHFDIQQLGQHTFLLIDDHDRPVHTIGVER